MNNKTTLIIGGSSAIALAIAKEQLDEDASVVIVSRQSHCFESLPANMTWLTIESYEQQAIDAKVAEINEYDCVFSEVFICNGVLHSQNFMPEKKLEDINANAFNTVLNSNALTPILWLKYLVPLLAGEHFCKLVVFSARVGSISDNQLGGWYSYRASKAALNMLLKTAAIELARRAKNIKIVIFHPGTTDTALSKPFQKNVPEGKLFHADFVARQLLNIIDNILFDGTASYLDWQGKQITW